MLLISGHKICNRLVSTSSAYFMRETRRLAIKNVYITRNHVRLLSTKDVFGGIDYSNISVPQIPIPPPPNPTIEELFATGKSVLSELGCFSWLTPPSYLRLLMESIHSIHLPILDIDIPWWTAICIVTCTIRLLSFPLVILTRKNQAIMKMYKPEIENFNEQKKIATAEGNTLLVQQLTMEQMDFMKKKNINATKHIKITLMNAAVFFCQYRAIRLLADVQYPGFSTGGALWFPDLVQPDYILPVIAAIVFHLSMKTGIETGGGLMHPAMKIFMVYVSPFSMVALNVVYFLFVPAGIPSAIWIHICASGSMTLLYALIFKIPAVCNFAGVPYLPADTKVKSDWQELVEWWRNRQSSKIINPANLRQQDKRIFESAGRKRPIIKK